MNKMMTIYACTHIKYVNQQLLTTNIIYNTNESIKHVSDFRILKKNPSKPFLQCSVFFMIICVCVIACNWISLYILFFIALHLIKFDLFKKQNMKRFNKGKFNDYYPNLTIEGAEGEKDLEDSFQTSYNPLSSSFIINPQIYHKMNEEDQNHLNDRSGSISYQKRQRYSSISSTSTDFEPIIRSYCIKIWPVAQLIMVLMMIMIETEIKMKMKMKMMLMT